MRKSLSINQDGSILIPKEIVEEVFGKAKEAVIHIRSHSLTLSPIYVDLNSGELPNILNQYFNEEKLSYIIENHFKRASSEGVQFEGDLSVLALSDVLLFLSASKKTGCLLIEIEKKPWGVFFHDGHLVFMAGEDYRFSLAACLLRRQILTEQDLVEGLRERGGNEPIKTLFAISGLTKEEFERERTLAFEEIIFHLFEITSGKFSFHNGELDKDIEHPLPLSTTNYVMEAMRRLDEFSRIQNQLPNLDAVLEISEDVTASTKLSFEEESVLAQVNGKRSFQEVIIRSKLHEIEAKKAVASLVAAGLVKVKKEKSDKIEVKAILDEEERKKFSTVIDSYNAVFCNIFQALSVEAGSKTMVILSPFFKGLEKGGSILYGLSLEEDGSINQEKVLQNLSQFGKEKREEILVKDLNELLYFQLFAVKNSLGPELEEGIVEMAKTLLGHH